jgi:hypothetical protein
MSGDEIVQLAVRLGLLAFLVYWSFVLVRPFIPIPVWSMVLTVALYPPYDWLSVHLGDRPKLAAATITVIILAIIIGPVTWLGFGLIDGLQGLRASSAPARSPFRRLPKASRTGRSSARRFTPFGTMLRQI